MRNDFTCEQCYRTEDQDNAVQIADGLYCLDCVTFDYDSDGNKFYLIKPKGNSELTPIEQDAMSACDNESSTKGGENGPQGAWDNSQIYADTYGHDVADFRRTLLSLYRGHICK